MGSMEPRSQPNKEISKHMQTTLFSSAVAVPVDILTLFDLSLVLQASIRVRESSEPTCITGVINWVHGTYALNGNGSMTLTPFGDGYQQIQDPCAAVSNFLEDYNLTETYTQWRIFQDPVTGFKLHLFQFDGAPLAPQFQISTIPNMLPTRLLRNIPTSTTSAGNGVKTPSRRSLLQKKSNDAPASQLALAFGATIGMVTLSIAALLI
ncbi:hypothetical protein C0992_000405 [Termitomyces sp. T32_za158]|nr:hypothetical protein C0992_000405 [Termitomyces sp. T32_za158]